MMGLAFSALSDCSKAKVALAVLSINGALSM